MTKRIFISSLFATLLPLFVLSQRIKVFGGESDQELVMMPCIIADSLVIDTSKLEVYYRYEFQRFKKPMYAIIRMQIGNRQIKQTDMCSYASSIYNALFKQGGKSTALDSLQKASKVFGTLSNLFMEMSEESECDCYTVICGDYFTMGIPVSYREPCPDLVWILQSRDTTICGYQCHAAETDFRGRKWCVWFSPEIPMHVGPWKLRGLPGLILSAETAGFRFECVRLKESRLPIYRNRYDKMQDFKTRERYRRYERNCFEHPYETFAQGEEAYIFVTGADKKPRPLDKSWTIPYNPIELE